MTVLLDALGGMTLLWPPVLCAVAWGLVIWALRQRDPVSEAVNGLMSPHRSVEAAGRSDLNPAKPPVDIGPRTHRSGRPNGTAKAVPIGWIKML